VDPGDVGDDRVPRAAPLPPRAAEPATVPGAARATAAGAARAAGAGDGTTVVSSLDPRPRPAPRDPHRAAGDVDLVIPIAALPHLEALRRSLNSYRASPAIPELDRAFAAGSALACEVAPAADGRRPDLQQVRRLAARVPEFDTLLSVAADTAGSAARSAAAALWATLGLCSTPPGWSAEEREAARMVFGCACVLAQAGEPARLRRGLRSLAAPRLAQRLTDELAHHEDAWVRALGDRYPSVRHRCAQRTAWRSRGLAELIVADEACRTAVARRLERWLAGGGETRQLGAELEAALVHARTPPKFA
jgi:hypothetical protein